MSESKNGVNRDLLEQYQSALEAVDVDYAISDTGEALMTFGETEAGQCDGFVVVATLATVDPVTGDEHELEYSEVAFVLPVSEVAEERQGALFELVVRLNEFHRLGAYEFQPDVPELRFRSYQTFPPGSAVSRAVLLAPFFEALTTIDAEWKAFTMVLDDGHDPTHAMAEILVAKAVEDEDYGLDQDVFAAGVQYFKSAIRRYESRGDDERATLARSRMAEASEEIARSVKSALN